MKKASSELAQFGYIIIPSNENINVICCDSHNIHLFGNMYMYFENLKEKERLYLIFTQNKNTKEYGDGSLYSLNDTIKFILDTYPNLYW